MSNPKPSPSTNRRRNRKEKEIVSSNVPEPPILKILADLYEQQRPRIKPVYPLDPKANTIHLPPEIVQELQTLVRTGHKPAALKRVAELTGAGLRLAKDFVDALQEK